MRLTAKRNRGSLLPDRRLIWVQIIQYGTSFAYSKRIALELASVTAAAQKLGIHRNTMEYRLRKFNDLSGISNYTADIVERLLFTYKILDLYPEILEEKDIL